MMYRHRVNSDSGLLVPLRVPVPLVPLLLAVVVILEVALVVLLLLESRFCRVRKNVSSDRLDCPPLLLTRLLNFPSSSRKLVEGELLQQTHKNIKIQAGKNATSQLFVTADASQRHIVNVEGR